MFDPLVRNYHLQKESFKITELCYLRVFEGKWGISLTDFNHAGIFACI